MRLIDADALLKEIDGIHQRHYANSSYQFIHDFFLAMFRRIKNAPTVDVVPVVRCKDCKWWGGKYSSNECSKITTLSNPDYWLKTLPEDFCSSGERRDDNA